MQEYPLISVVVPVHNEEQNLPHVLPRIPHFVGEVILVDGYSTLATVEFAREVYPTIHMLDQRVLQNRGIYILNLTETGRD